MLDTGRKTRNGAMSVWSTSTAGIDTVLATTIGASINPKTFSTNHLPTAGLLVAQLPNANSAPQTHFNSNVQGNGGLNHSHHHQHHLVTNASPTGNGPFSSHSTSTNSNNSHSSPSHGSLHNSVAWNRTSICSAYNKRRSAHGGTMSQSGGGYNSPHYLSWRKLQLSRAKLKASSKTSALLSGFAMVAMVEVQLDENTTVPPSMLITFAVCTTLLVAVHMLALMISTCILPNIETVCNLHSISLVNESPHERLHWYIETAWAFSTVLGLILFLLEIAILCWVKFYDLNTTAAWSACIVLIPVLIIFVVFALHFYRSLVTHKYEVSASGIRELEMLKEQMEQDQLDLHHHHGGPPYQSVQIV
ncbi:calcium release-activated calcium channel protein 1 isoform X1 [Toxorhynchites rutilus septentrionalis]|uniref:calcium release-activated calcium channel protein 1 isoform X1 n=1 Tax=Toxorhynchites rutilus septentrionalis TaxID=329112 RepID=UPI0024793195|nr:calcium release-activated calcium channel protein 1 isoform X1 [Toxorhynchites rutilus septentrionalis]